VEQSFLNYSELNLQLKNKNYMKGLENQIKNKITVNSNHFCIYSAPMSSLHKTEIKNYYTLKK